MRHALILVCAAGLTGCQPTVPIGRFDATGITTNGVLDTRGEGSSTGVSTVGDPSNISGSTSSTSAGLMTSGALGSTSGGTLGSTSGAALGGAAPEVLSAGAS